MTGTAVPFGEQPYPGPADARVVILPVPYAPTVSWGRGAEAGPTAILRASQFIDELDEETGCDWMAVGIRTAPAVVPVAPGEAAVEAIRAAWAEQLASGAFVIGLGGEHAVTAGAVFAVREAHPEAGVLQIDAHPDLRPSYEGSPWSHACVMRRVAEAGVPIVAVGIRAVSHADRAAIEEGLSRVFRADEIHGDPDWVDRVLEALPPEVFVTLDVDGLDPSVMPATGTPEPGGLGYRDVLALLRRVFRERTVVGADVVELAPIPGLHHADFTAARLVQKMIAYRFPAGE